MALREKREQKALRAHHSKGSRGRGILSLAFSH